MTFLSIIIPTFNSSAYFENALKSLKDQSFQDFEVIVIDGMSTDRTKDVFDRYRHSFASTKWISEKDRGVYDAMNKGLLKSTGEWIYLMGSDDTLYHPHVLQQVRDFISKSTADVVYGNVLTKSFGGGVYAGFFTPQKLYAQNISHQALFFKQSVFNSVGNFSLKYPINADWEHNFRWFLSGKIRHEYFDIIIANFGHEGISSTKRDRTFFRDRDWNYAISGRPTLGLKTIIWHILKEYKACLRDKNFLRLIKKMADTPFVIFFGLNGPRIRPSS